MCKRKTYASITFCDRLGKSISILKWLWTEKNNVQELRLFNRAGNWKCAVWVHYSENHTSDRFFLLQSFPAHDGQKLPPLPLSVLKCTSIPAVGALCTQSSTVGLNHTRSDDENRIYQGLMMVDIYQSLDVWCTIIFIIVVLKIWHKELLKGSIEVVCYSMIAVFPQSARGLLRKGWAQGKRVSLPKFILIRKRLCFSIGWENKYKTQCHIHIFTPRDIRE